MKYGNLTWGQTEALVNKLGGEEVVRDILAGKIQWAITKQVKKLLTHVSAIRVSGIKKFIAADHFNIDTSRKAKVKIAWMGNNFRSNFLSKTETDVPEGELNVYTLTQASLDKHITDDLGEWRETHLADLWVTLEKQPGGENGTLLTNGYANIFYVCDVNGKLWAVGADWHAYDGGWVLFADSVGNPGRWVAGDQVLSR